MYLSTEWPGYLFLSCAIYSQKSVTHDLFLKTLNTALGFFKSLINN